MSYSKFIEACHILAKYSEDVLENKTPFEAGHGIIWSHVTSEDGKKLDELGWFIDEEES